MTPCQSINQGSTWIIMEIKQLKPHFWHIQSLNVQVLTISQPAPVGVTGRLGGARGSPPQMYRGTGGGPNIHKTWQVERRNNRESLHGDGTRLSEVCVDHQAGNALKAHWERKMTLFRVSRGRREGGGWGWRGGLWNHRGNNARKWRIFQSDVGLALPQCWVEGRRKD